MIKFNFFGQTSMEESSIFLPLSYDKLFYLLKKGTTLFRGDTYLFMYENSKMTNSPIKILKSPVYAGIDLEEVSSYGVIYELIVKKDLELLALDKEPARTYIMEQSESRNRPDILRILQTNFGIGAGASASATGLRNSTNEEDQQIAKFICNNLKYDGYATNSMPTDLGGTFHKEIMICSSDNVSVSKMITTDSKIQGIIDETRMRQTEKERINRKMQSHRSRSSSTSPASLSPASPIGFPRFNLSEDSYSTPKKNLFMTPKKTPNPQKRLMTPRSPSPRKTPRT